MKPVRVPIGTKINKWLVIGEPTFIQEKNHRVSAVMCRCECGKERLVRCNKLLSGKSKSCTCIRRNNESDFWSKVEKTESCWLFRNSKTAPYGEFCWNRVPERAHRVSWLLTFGAIPSGLFVCHHCDVKNCVNPEHLFIGTNADNMKDMKDKGRHVSAPQFGESNPMAKLTSQAVRKIRALLKKGQTQKKISKMFGVSRANIWMIKNERTWKTIS